MYIIPWRLRNSLEIFTVSLKNDELKECTCSLYAAQRSRELLLSLGMVLLGGCMSRDLENSDKNMGFRVFFHSVNKLQVHKEGL